MKGATIEDDTFAEQYEYDKYEKILFIQPVHISKIEKKTKNKESREL